MGSSQWVLQMCRFAESRPATEAVEGRRMISAAWRIVRNEAARDRICVLLLRTLSMISAYLVSWWCVNDLVA